MHPAVATRGEYQNHFLPQDARSLGFLRPPRGCFSCPGPPLFCKAHIALGNSLSFLLDASIQHNIRAQQANHIVNLPRRLDFVLRSPTLLLLILSP